MEKKFFYIALLLFSVQNLFSKPVLPSHTEKITLVSSSDGCAIYYIEKDGESWYDVIATIATSFLPSTAQGICMMTIKNAAVCNVVFDVTATLVGLQGANIQAGVSDGLQWVANRGTSVSSAKVTTPDYETASAVKSVFVAYKENESVNWSSIEGNGSVKPAIKSEASCSGTLIIITQNAHALVNVRERPSINAEVLFQINGGDECRIVARTTSKTSVKGFELPNYWYKIQTGNLTGWVFGGLTSRKQ